MRRFSQRRPLFSLLLVTSLLPGWAFAQTTFERMCIFGDSLSDTGNVFEVTQDVSTRPYALIPSAPYPIGGPTFTNGRTWIQHLAESLERDDDAKPAFQGSGPFCNYSFGGARARASRPFDLPDLVARYLADVGGTADPNTLYIVSVGGNDIRDALESPTEASVIIGAAVQSVFDQIGALYQGGARKFLVVNAPNLGLVPAVSLQGAEAQFAATFVTSLFNDGVASVLGFLPPDVELMTFDLFAFANAVAAQPPAGVTNTTDSCITPGVRQGATCADPDQHMFWDGIHPTRVIHAALAEAVAQTLPILVASSN